MQKAHSFYLSCSFCNTPQESVLFCFYNQKVKWLDIKLVSLNCQGTVRAVKALRYESSLIKPTLLWEREEFKVMA